LLYSLLIVSNLDVLYSWTRKQNPQPAKVCFSIDLTDCQSAQNNAVLKIGKISREILTSPNGTKYTKETITETKSETVFNTTEKYVTGWRIVCLGSGYDVQCSWRDLFYHQHGRYPNNTELANMTTQNAIDWFRDKYKDSGWKCWPSGTQYPDVYTTNSMINKQNNPICFDWSDPITNDPSFSKNNQLPFQMELEFPGYGKCQLEAVPAVSVVKPKEGETRKVILRIKKPCAYCYYNN
jgi:hypothetical protein